AERESLREAYAATLVKKPAYRPGFDVLFDLWFPPAISGLRRRGEVDADEAPVAELREHLAGLLTDGGEAELRAFARAMVERFGRHEAGPGRQNWVSYQIGRASCREGVEVSTA